MSRSSHHRARKRVAAGLEQIEPGYSTYRYDAPAFGAVAVKVFPGEHVAGVALTAALVAAIGVLSSLDVLRHKPLATLRAE